MILMGEIMSDVQDNILTRRTVYKFTDKDVPESIINQALIAASKAPCHKHTHPWKFYVLGPEIRGKLIPVIKKLAELKSIKLGSKDLEKDAERAIRKITQPPILIVITSKKDPEDKFREKEDYAATVCALHNMVLSFWDNDIGSQWSSGSITRDLDTYHCLSINPNTEEIIGFLKAGYPDVIPNVKKPSFEELTVYLD
tara:strand:- start:1747 stop:2340 length:594 start_codon:yes stop_codon:yes gene_type:complete